MSPISFGRPLLHPLHAILLAFPVALFTGALASDITYLKTSEMQWSNFASWGIAAALFFGGFVLLWALIDFARYRRGALRSRVLLYLLLLLAMWVLGLINAFGHSQDAWSSVGARGVILSALSALLAVAAAWIGHSTLVRETV